MVSTRRSRSLTAQTEDAAEAGQGSQQDVSSGNNNIEDNATAGHSALGQLQPIAEEPAVAAATPEAAAAADQDAVDEQEQGQQQHDEQQAVADERRQRVWQPQQPQQPALSPLPAARRSGGGAAAAAPAAAAAAASEDESVSEQGADGDDDEDGWDFDGDDMLQNLAATIRSALGSSEPAGQQQQLRQAAAAAADGSDAEDMELDNLRWRPQTGLQLPARAARVVAAAAAGNQQQQQLTSAGPQVHNPAVAAAATEEEEQDMTSAAVAPAPEGPSVAAATKPKGLAKQLPAAAETGKQRRGKKGSGKGAAAAAAGPEGANRKWYQLPAVEITDGVKRDLRLLRLRGAYDPKRFYKSFDETKFPKHFAIGTVVDDALDFYGGRLNAGQRKATLTEQLLADQELQHTRKKRYGRLQEEAQKWVKHKKRKTSQPRKTPSKHRPKH